MYRGLFSALLLVFFFSTTPTNAQDNLDFDSWSSGFPASWEVNAISPASVCEVGAGESYLDCGSSGGGMVNFYSDGLQPASISQNIITLGVWNTLTVEVDNVVNGGLYVYSGGDLLGYITSAGTKTYNFLGYQRTITLTTTSGNITIAGLSIAYNTDTPTPAPTSTITVSTPVNVNCGYGLPCGPVPWDLPNFPALVSPSPFPTQQATATPIVLYTYDGIIPDGLEFNAGAGEYILTFFIEDTSGDQYIDFSIMQLSPLSGYRLTIGSDNSLVLSRVDNGTGTVLTSSSSVVYSGDKLSIRAGASGISIYVNGSVVLQSPDNDYNGYPLVNYTTAGGSIRDIRVDPYNETQEIINLTPTPGYDATNTPRPELTDIVEVFGTVAVITPITELDGLGGSGPISIQSVIDVVEEDAGLFFGYVKGVSSLNIGVLQPLIDNFFLMVGFFLVIMSMLFIVPVLTAIASMVRKLVQLVLDFIPG
jgi:hypothetical protein